MDRTKRSRRFPSVYRGPDLTDPEVDLNVLDTEEIEYALSTSKLSDEELSEINIRDIADDVSVFDELVGNNTDSGATVSQDAIHEVN